MTPSSPAQAEQRAAASLRALEQRLGERHGQLREGPGGPTSSVWAKAQAIEAALDQARITGDYGKAERMLAGLKAYGLGNGYAPGIHPPKNGSVHRWYDDNSWVGLAYMQMYDQTHQQKYLRDAENVFKFIQSGVGLGGGVRETQGLPKPTYNSVSSGAAAELALRLYQDTGKEHYLKFAKHANQFMDKHLLTPRGLYADHTDARGHRSPGNGKENAVWSYNQGLAVGVKVGLYEALRTSDPKAAQAYLRQAVAVAKSALGHFGLSTLATQPVMFNAIYFRNLEKLSVVSGDPALNARIQASLGAYSQWVWKHRRVQHGRNEDLFFDVTPGAKWVPSLLASAGAAQLFAIQDMTPSELEQIG